MIYKIGDVFTLNGTDEEAIIVRFEETNYRSWVHVLFKDNKPRVYAYKVFHEHFTFKKAAP